MPGGGEGLVVFADFDDAGRAGSLFMGRLAPRVGGPAKKKKSAAPKKAAAKKKAPAKKAAKAKGR